MDTQDPLTSSDVEKKEIIRPPTFATKCHALLKATVFKEEFKRQYQKICDGRWKRKQFYITCVNILKTTITEGDLNTFRKLDTYIAYLNNIEIKSDLANFYSLRDNTIRSTNPVILACKYNQIEILRYMFSSTSKILNSLTVDIGRNAISFKDEDEECHNAFYYSVRSNNIELLDTLITMWPEDYLLAHPLELDKILSEAYEELLIRRVPLSDPMYMYNAKRLLDFRFFSNKFHQSPIVNNNFANIIERIQLVTDYVSLLVDDYSEAKEVRDRFLFVARCIAQNIQILKRQLKSTYNTIPWEEMEFCLNSFISSYMERKETNFFCRVTLNKNKILSYLEDFAKVLENQRDFALFTDLPKEERKIIKARIIKTYPQFEGLYADHRKLREAYSLCRMSDYIKFALTFDPRPKSGQLAIVRALQVISECLKNTLESPKLSDTVSKLLLMTFSKETRNVVLDMRDSTSAAESLAIRIKIEEYSDAKFFVGVLDDFREVETAIECVLHNEVMKIMKMLLEKIVNSESVDDVKEVLEVVIATDMFLTVDDFTNYGVGHLDKLFKELDDVLTTKTGDDIVNLGQIRNHIEATKTFRVSESVHYWRPFDVIKRVSILFSSRSKIDDRVVLCMKNNAKEVLMYINPAADSPDMKPITPQLHMLLCGIEERIGDEEADLKLRRLMCRISYLTEGRAGTSKRFDRLWATLNNRSPFKSFPLTKKNYNAFLAKRATELRHTVTHNAVITNVMTNASGYKQNKRLLLVLEMIFLDILDSLDDYLDDNTFFCVNSSPTLTGKCLRDFLAHDNILPTVFLSDAVTMVALNAATFNHYSENIIKSKAMLGRRTVDNYLELRHKNEEMLKIVTLQEKMLAATDEVSVNYFSTYTRAGADMYGRNLYFWTPLHLAAKGTDVDVVKFVNKCGLNVYVRDIYGQSPLHIAAANGGTHVVKYLIEELNCSVNVKDYCNRTPLHVAVENSHQDVVTILLAHEAELDTVDISGNTPVQYAIRNNRVDIVKMLVEKDADLSGSDGAERRYSLLSTATESGSVDTVNFFIANKFEVSGKNVGDYMTPLHLAALKGHLEILQALISNGADVNVNVKENGTPLYCATHENREAITEALLEHGANPNICNDSHNNAALHFAAQHGYVNIVLSLLKHEADPNIMTVLRMTPLHFAAQSGHLEVADILIRHGADVNARNVFDWTLLASAAKRAPKDVVELLVKKGANINIKTSGFAPLHGAAEGKQLEVVKFLIRNKADVNLKARHDMTPLHVAAAVPRNEKVIRFLLNKKASVDAENNELMTPLHMAVGCGCLGNVSALIRYKANVNVLNIAQVTPLHLAVHKGHKEIVQLLLKQKAVVNTNPKTLRPLNVAVNHGHKEIVEILLRKEAKIVDREQDITMLLNACTFNYTGIVELLMLNGVQRFPKWVSEAIVVAIRYGRIETVELLLRYGTSVTKRYSNQNTLLHVAATVGYVNIVDTIISKGADVNATNTTNLTPLHLAAQQGHDRVVESLLANGARTNIKSSNGDSPLHLAIEMGHHYIVKLLLDNGASINAKNADKRAPLELAVVHNHLQVVQALLGYKKFDLNADYTYSKLLHFASQAPSLKMVKYLTSKGADIHGKRFNGMKAIHVAGDKDITEYFLSKGVGVDEVDVDGKTPLHYAVQNERLEVIQCLIDHGADVNAKTNTDRTPLDIALMMRSKAVVELLLKNDAVSNSCKLPSKKPIAEIRKLLKLNQKFLDAVQRDDANRTWQYIKQGAVVNVRDAKDLIPLHHAARNGYHDIVRILIQNGAKVDAMGAGRTPLHYAVQYSHLEIVRTLLANGATQNVRSRDGRTPLYMARDEKIKHLLRLISRSFRAVKEDDVRIVFELQLINDIETMKAVMNARNEDGETLIVAATRSQFSDVDALNDLLPNGTVVSIDANVDPSAKDDHRNFSVSENPWDGSGSTLKPENVATFGARSQMADTLYDQGNYRGALTIYEEIYKKQSEMLGDHHKSTLRTRSRIAFTLGRLARDGEAFNIHYDLYKKQLGRSGVFDLHLIKIQFQLGLSLCNLEQYQDTLNMYSFVYEKRRNILGPTHLSTLRVLKSLAVTLYKQGSRKEALNMFINILGEERSRYGTNHVNTFQSIYNIATIYSQHKMYKEALINFRELLALQNVGLGPNHPDTLIIHHRIMSLFVKLGELRSALKICVNILPRMRAVFPPSDPALLEILKLLRDNTYFFKDMGITVPLAASSVQEKINNAAATGDEKPFEQALGAGFDMNSRDTDGKTPASGGQMRDLKSSLDNKVDVNAVCSKGKTPLYLAVENNRTEIVEYLLNIKADVNIVCNEGKSLLHIATEYGHKNIVELLLHHVRRDKLSDYINIKSSATGTTSLHIAAQNGFTDIAFCLLSHGAIYNIEDKDGKTPCDLSKDETIFNLLKLTHVLFNEAKRGETVIINEISGLKKSQPKMFSALTNARNIEGNTVLQVAIFNRRKEFANVLLKLLK